MPYSMHPTPFNGRSSAKPWIESLKNTLLQDKDVKDWLELVDSLMKGDALEWADNEHEVIAILALEDPDEADKQRYIELLQDEYPELTKVDSKFEALKPESTKTSKEDERLMLDQAHALGNVVNELMTARPGMSLEAAIDTITESLNKKEAIRKAKEKAVRKANRRAERKAEKAELKALNASIQASYSASQPVPTSYYHQPSISPPSSPTSPSTSPAYTRDWRLREEKETSTNEDIATVQSFKAIDQSRAEIHDELARTPSDSTPFSDTEDFNSTSALSIARASSAPDLACDSASTVFPTSASAQTSDSASSVRPSDTDTVEISMPQVNDVPDTSDCMDTYTSIEVDIQDDTDTDSTAVADMEFTAENRIVEEYDVLNTSDCTHAYILTEVAIQEHTAENIVAKEYDSGPVEEILASGPSIWITTTTTNTDFYGREQVLSTCPVEQSTTSLDVTATKVVPKADMEPVEKSFAKNITKPVTPHLRPVISAWIYYIITLLISTAMGLIILLSLANRKQPTNAIYKGRPKVKIKPELLHHGGQDFNQRMASNITWLLHTAHYTHEAKPFSQRFTMHSKLQSLDPRSSYR